MFAHRFIEVYQSLQIDSNSVALLITTAAFGSDFYESSLTSQLIVSNQGSNANALREGIEQVRLNPRHVSSNSKEVEGSCFGDSGDLEKWGTVMALSCLMIFRNSESNDEIITHYIQLSYRDQTKLNLLGSAAYDASVEMGASLDLNGLHSYVRKAPELGNKTRPHHVQSNLLKICLEYVFRPQMHSKKSGTFNEHVKIMYQYHSLVTCCYPYARSSYS